LSSKRTIRISQNSITGVKMCAQARVTCISQMAREFDTTNRLATRAGPRCVRRPWRLRWVSSPNHGGRGAPGCALVVKQPC
jgi:hypothetical protein